MSAGNPPEKSPPSHHGRSDTNGSRDAQDARLQGRSVILWRKTIKPTVTSSRYKQQIKKNKINGIKPIRQKGFIELVVCLFVSLCMSVFHRGLIHMAVLHAPLVKHTLHTVTLYSFMNQSDSVEGSAPAGGSKISACWSGSKAE